MYVCLAPGFEGEKRELQREVEKLKAKVEYEMQPNIAFEEESQALQVQVWMPTHATDDLAKSSLRHIQTFKTEPVFVCIWA